jgi:hypothetical protein
MDANSERRPFQFGLRGLLIVAAVLPPIIGGCVLFVRWLGVTAPTWAIAGTLIQLGVWGVVFILMIRRVTRRG